MPGPEEIPLQQRLANIDMIALEAEGVLTDGSAWWDMDGRQSIRLNKIDYSALPAWHAQGGKTVILARPDLTALASWSQQTGATLIHYHNNDKSMILKRLILDNGLVPDKVAYLGANLDDLPPMIVAGLAVSPADAPAWVRGGAHLELSKAGGQGALAEFLDRTMQARLSMSKKPDKNK